jgi:hypothetical protein
MRSLRVQSDTLNTTDEPDLAQWGEEAAGLVKKLWPEVSDGEAVYLGTRFALRIHEFWWRARLPAEVLHVKL